MTSSMNANKHLEDFEKEIFLTFPILITMHAVLVWHVQYFIAPHLILKSFQNQMLLQQV